MIQSVISSFKRIARRTILLAGMISCVITLPLQGIGQDPPATASQTVTQALMDLRSGLPEKRRGSIMLLAKYPQHPGALPAIVTALEDPEPTVRRAAVVSLGENIRSLNPLQASRLVGALQDEDPEVRLSSSAWLPQLVLYSSALPTNSPQFQGAAAEQQTLVDGITAGLRDSEPLIRLKSVEALQFLRWPIPQEILIPLLGDPDERVRIQAFETLFAKLPRDVFISAAVKRHPDPDPRVRLVLAEVLSRQAFPGSRDLLESLAEDPVSGIQLQANIGLYLLDPAAGLGPVLESALMRGDLDDGTIFRIFNSLNRLPPEQIRAIAEPFLKSASVTVRTQAAMIWLRSHTGPPPSDILLGILTDSASEVRQQALRHVGSAPEAPTQEILLSLPENPYQDVRRMALAISLRMPAAEQNQLALRLLMDTVPEIRMEALVRIIQLRPDNWPRLLRASLRDPAPIVTQAAARALLDNLGEEGRQIAEAYAREHPQADVSAQIRAGLKQN